MPTARRRAQRAGLRVAKLLGVNLQSPRSNNKTHEGRPGKSQALSVHRERLRGWNFLAALVPVTGVGWGGQLVPRRLVVTTSQCMQILDHHVVQLN